MRKQTSVKDILDQDYVNTPDPVRIRGGYTKGERTKQSVMEFWFSLFEANELRAKKMTNSEIARQMIVEFPRQPAIAKLAEASGWKVNHYRSLYNTGRLLSYKPGRPTYISFRYNEKGEKVNSRTSKVLSKDEIAAYIQKYTTYKIKSRTKVFKPRRKKVSRKRTAAKS